MTKFRPTRLILRRNDGLQVDVIPSTPITLTSLKGEIMGILTPEGKYIPPSETNVGKIIEVWDGFEKTEMEIVWDGSVPESMNRKTKGHSKGLLLDDYQVSGDLYRAIESETHPNWCKKGRLKK